MPERFYIQPQKPQPQPQPQPQQLHTDASFQQYLQEDEINLFDLFSVLMNYKRLILLVTALVTLGAFIMAMTMSPVYRAEVLMLPASQEGNSGIRAMAGQLGGLAALAGINIGGSGGNSLDEALAVINSREFTNKFIRDQKILPVLFAQQWDANTKQWIDKVPTEGEGFAVFNSIRTVKKNTSTGMVTLAIEWNDSQQAADWANNLVDHINVKLRNESILKAERSIQYLNAELKKTSIIEVKQSIYSLIEAQTKNKMLASVQDGFAFRVLDKAVVPEKKIKPNKKLIVILGFVLGGMLSIFLVFLLHFIKKQGLRNEIG